MSTNHNRIKVADLETNQPNKILKTNLNGELEFSDVSTLKTENYNALDCTSEGKALDARQGKVLKDMIDNVNPSSILVNDLMTGGTSEALTAEMGKVLNETKLTATIATDDEVQIAAFVPEDNKVLSRSKLFNWWENIKIKTQTISSTWNFSKGLKVNDTMSGNTTEMLQNMFVAQLDRQDNGINKTEYGGETIKWTTRDGSSTLLKPITPNQNRTLTLPNKSGTIAIINDYVKAASGTATTPSLIIPNGVLTTNPQNGAIERDANGVLWETHGGVRNQLSGGSDVSLVNDLTTGGTTKALTAEMGKQLNEIKHPCEDQRLSQDQKVKFTHVLVNDDKYTTNMACYEVRSLNRETYFSTRLTPDAIIAQSSDARKIEVKYDSINFISNPYTDKKGSLLTHFLTGARSWYLQDKDGTIALTNDYVVTAPGNDIRPSLIIPNGTLTTIPVNGAIERDQNGQLWETHNGVRYKLLNTLDASLFVAKENLPTDIVNNDITTTPTKSSLNLLYPDIPVGTYIHFTKIQSNPNFPVTYRKTTFGWIMFGFTQIIQ